MIKNILPDKLANPESLRKVLPHFESFSTNPPVFGQDSYKLFYNTVSLHVLKFSHIAQLLPIHSFIVFVLVHIFPLNMCDIIIYVAWWWKKYLSKRNIIKHTCLWSDKLIILWTLSRQAKILLRIFSVYSSVIQVISEKTLCSKGFTSNLWDIFTWKQS